MRTATFVLALTLLTLSGCKRDIGCTDLAAFSVTVTVEDPDGSPIADAEVTYTVDGGAEQDCMEGGQAGEYICGLEEPGDFEITASAPDYSTNTGTTSVDTDECHVIGEGLTIVLDPVLLQ